MGTLINRLPAEALLSQTPQEIGQEPWDTKTELLAQLVEVLSVVAVEGQGLKKPIQVPRPGHIAALMPTATAPAAPANDPRYPDGPGARVVDLDAYKKGVATLLATSKGVRR